MGKACRVEVGDRRNLHSSRPAHTIGIVIERAVAGVEDEPVLGILRARRAGSRVELVGRDCAGLREAREVGETEDNLVALGGGDRPPLSGPY